MSDLDWTNHKVEAVDQAPSCIIEAPSQGIAIEYYLAIHGMTTYDTDKMTCREVTENPEETKERVEELMGEITVSKMIELNKWHTWKVE